MRVEILDGCIACGACEAINSEVFEVTDSVHVNDENVNGNEDDCLIAAEACPVNVIKIVED
jgi:ferredoxin